MLQRAFRCACGQPVFFRNSACLACGRALGYEPHEGALHALEPAPGEAGGWHVVGMAAGARRQRCSLLDTPAACNWLVTEDGSGSTMCLCCRQLRTKPDLADADVAAAFGAIERARRRLVSALIALRLPVASKLDADPDRGIAFDVLQATADMPRVVTGHADGIITIDLAEADDAVREQRRRALREPYRTLLGHLRHESGHYLWQRLVQPDAAWLDAFRAVFGDERADYAAALHRHHEQGPRADWALHHVSAYAAAHPWEDWAETWAHWLHLVDTLDTARSFGLDGSGVELQAEPFDTALLHDVPEPGPAPAGAEPRAAFIALLQRWAELTAVLNELARSMGVADLYPFVLPAAAVRKLYLVQRLIRSQAARLDRTTRVVGAAQPARSSTSGGTW